MEELIVQPMGGFTGMGAPGAAKTEGRTTMSALSSEDRAKVDELFLHAQSAQGNFYYRITKKTAAGSQSVDVAADQVPPALLATVKTTLQ